MPIPSTLGDILCNLLPVFTEPSGQCFLRVVAGWILCPGRRTITGMMPFIDPEGIRQHDTYHRFFRAAAWCEASLFKLWALLLVKNFAPARILWVQTDDTVIKKTGRKVEGAKYCRDAVRSTRKKTVFAWGLQIVPVCIRIIPPWGGEPISLPVNMRIYRKGGPSLNDLVEEMMIQLVDWFPTRDFHLVADGAYAPLAGRHIPRTEVTSRMRKDAAIYELAARKNSGGGGRPRKKGKRLPVPEKMAKRKSGWRMVDTCERGKQRKRLVYTRKVLWYKVDKEKLVLLVISRDPNGIEKDDFFFTTDLTYLVSVRRGSQGEARAKAGKGGSG